MNGHVTPAGPDWRERIHELRALLDELRPQLIDAEAQLAERLATISAFEFQLRARLEPLSNRLDDIQAEIDALRREMRRFRESVPGWDEAAATSDSEHGWRFEESAASSGDYRYRPKAQQPRPALEGKRLTTLKQLYRRLARRFHPDLALDETDREYRTGLMMAVNAAYALGDLAKLEQLAEEPDSVSRAPQTPEETAAALQREADHCVRRLDEIAKELATLERHNSARLMRRVERAAAVGRDLLAEMAADLRLRISEKMVERDVLETQLEEMEREGVEVSIDDLADIVFNLGLEQADEGNLLGSDGEWRPRKPRPWESNDGQDEDDILDDSY